jgi:hypothetical protein
MDHTIFELLEQGRADVWFEKARFLRQCGGMALMLTHPDYLLTPNRVGEYERFVSFAAEERDVWAALPRDVAAWWRRRASSSIARDGNAWRVSGPAAREARVVVGVSRSP